MATPSLSLWRAPARPRSGHRGAGPFRCHHAAARQRWRSADRGKNHDPVGNAWRAEAPDRTRIGPCSQPSRPLRAASGGGLRPVLTSAARGPLRWFGRDGETAPVSRTEKLASAREKPLPRSPRLKNLEDQRLHAAAAPAAADRPARPTRAATDGRLRRGHNNRAAEPGRPCHQFHSSPGDRAAIHLALELTV
jgi:hypothetical protein